MEEEEVMALATVCLWTRQGPVLSQTNSLTEWEPAALEATSLQ